MSVPESLYIGWDVGGWNCDNNPSSRDALVVIDKTLHLVGTPWRGNLRATLNESPTSRNLIHRLLELCQYKASGSERVVMAVDTPLALPTALLALAQGAAVETLGRSQDNPYLYRETERWLFQRGVTPLSPIKDMIGSQATKGMHLLARFAPHIAVCGQWQSAEGTLCVVEGYPTPAKRSEVFAALRARVAMPPEFAPILHHPTPKQQDIQDAWHCALLAWSVEHAKETIAWPPAEMPAAEGWIFVPCDALTE
ncbi:DUF429 domain-containing protein [Halomonas sp. GT]|uniref:DUF429 domain-containing protein n=1 Tax=Halomonas sp. GT TaxID=1971364 RepID=UPI0009F56192|nr:DUF429 domain-containing protein [Halomonas sp. GT]